MLQDEGVAAREHHREHPHRHHRRKVERRDAGNHAQGLAEGDGVDAVADLFGKLAFQHLRDTASELDDLEAADQLALGVGEHLAMLGGDHRRQPVEIALDEVAEAEERARSEEHTSELQSLMRISYAVFCSKKKKKKHQD